MKSLYVHIPFCQRKCLFCSFAVSIGQEHRADDYIMMLDKEMSLYKNETIETVYWGGGTPTLLSAQQMSVLISVMRKHFDLSRVREWTVEANPEGVEVDKLHVLKEAGVNRLSLGVQSWNDHWLKFLGRCHDSRKAREVYDQLRSLGWDNVNLDLMYSFPGQTDEEIKNDVCQMASLGSEHISLYALTIEDNSRFGTRQVNLDGEMDRARQYQLVVDELSAVGVEQYEVSNFARHKKYSYHNRQYWLGGEYIGVGVGAHSHIQGRRYWNDGRLLSYMKKMRAGESVVEGEEFLSSYQKMMEVILFGLRMNEGVDVAVVENRFQMTLKPEQKEMLAHLCREGYVIEENSCLRVTDKGRLVLDEISVRLI